MFKLEDPIFIVSNSKKIQVIYNRIKKRDKSAINLGMKKETKKGGKN